jgi:hypothetical protein
MVILVCGLKSVTASEVVVISSSITWSKVRDQSSSHFCVGWSQLLKCSTASHSETVSEVSYHWQYLVISSQSVRSVITDNKMFAGLSDSHLTPLPQTSKLQVSGSIPADVMKKKMFFETACKRATMR